MATTPYPFVANTVLTASQLNSTYNIPVSAKTASYTLVAADGGTRVQMNSASATTITVNTSLFSAGDSVWLQNIGTGVMTVTAGTATVTTAGSLAVAQYSGGELYFTSASAAIFFPTGTAPATIAIFNESQAANTQGGASIASAYTKRTLNTSVINNIGATLTSSVIALLAGTYKVYAMSPFWQVGGVAIRLRNTTDSSTTVAGVNNYVSASSGAGCYAQLDGTFTITATKNFEVQYYCTAAQATNGLGVAINSAGVSEIYTQITIEKIG